MKIVKLDRTNIDLNLKEKVRKFKCAEAKRKRRAASRAERVENKRKRKIEKEKKLEALIELFGIRMPCHQCEKSKHIRDFPCIERELPIYYRGLCRECWKGRAYYSVLKGEFSSEKRVRKAVRYYRGKN